MLPKFVLLVVEVVVAPLEIEVMFPVMEAIGFAKVVQVPDTSPVTQFEVEPVRAKPSSVPLLLSPLASVAVVTVLLLPFTKPWSNLKYEIIPEGALEYSQLMLFWISPWHNALFHTRPSSIFPIKGPPELVE